MTLPHRLLSVGLVLALSLLSGVVRADPFPSRPIRIVVPFAPGGSSEIVARSVAAEMAKTIGANVIVENKPGGAGSESVRNDEAAV